MIVPPTSLVAVCSPPATKEKVTFPRSLPPPFTRCGATAVTVASTRWPLSGELPAGRAAGPPQQHAEQHGDHTEPHRRRPDPPGPPERHARRGLGARNRRLEGEVGHTPHLPRWSGIARCRSRCNAGPGPHARGRRPHRYTRRTVKATVEPLEGNKVKLSVEVDEQEFEQAVDAAFKKIAHEVRIPGFRPGKAPRRLLESRLGSGAGRAQALNDSLPEYYSDAVRDTEVDVIAPPEIDVTSGEEDGPITFEAVVEVRPVVEIEGYKDLKVEIPTPSATDEEIDAQIERLRGQFAELEVVERAAEEGDYVTIDIEGSQDGEVLEGLVASAYLYEVGSGAIVPELDEQLTRRLRRRRAHLRGRPPQQLRGDPRGAAALRGQRHRGQGQGAARSRRRARRPGLRVRHHRRAGGTTSSPA